MAERKEESNRYGPLAFLHQFAGYVVDCSYMIGIERVAKTERVGKRRGSQQNGVVVKRG
jgi:hypothetical protein